MNDKIRNVLGYIIIPRKGGGKHELVLKFIEMVVCRR